MDDRVLGRRGTAIENEFFRRHDAALLERRRADEARREARAALAAASRLSDESLLDELVAMGITADTLVALTLVPLIDVAWADGRLEAGERRAITAAARAAGLQAGSLGDRLVESCLTVRPTAGLRQLWRRYMESLTASLSPSERAGLKRELIRQGRTVAEAAGGFKGLLSSISVPEEAMLQEIERAFEI